MATAAPKKKEEPPKPITWAEQIQRQRKGPPKPQPGSALKEEKKK